MVFALLSGTVTLVFFWSRVFPALLRGGSVRAAVWTGLALYALAVTISAVGARVLWSRTPLSLDRLRAFELAGFATVAAIEVWRIFATMRAGSVFDHVSRDAVGMMLLASRQSLIWFGLIVAYGMFIPNTWRRCAAVVGLMALTPLASTAIANSLYGVLDGRLLFRFLSEVAMSMVFAAALAIYGSNRIEVLRREAFKARKLGQYQLKQPIGSGGMGDVYLAEHVLLRRPCAIKLIQPDRARDPNRLVRFEREVQATATLTHPNTVQVFDYGHAEDGTFYYVMEYLPGLTLDELVKRHGPAACRPHDPYPSASVRCPDRGSCHRPDPPRYQTGQYHRLRARRVARRGETAGLRDRAGFGHGAERAVADPGRLDCGHAGLHVARTGRRPAGSGRPQRYLQSGGCRGTFC